MDFVRGRFALDIYSPKLSPRYNIAPGQDAPVVLANEGRRALQLMRWGLVPSWAKEPAIGNRMINARAETIMVKASFKSPFQKRRCLVIADGFYEWVKGNGKTPLRVVKKTREPFAFAGLWCRWKSPEGNELSTFTIITSAPNNFMSKIHHRMPVILRQKDESAWLDPEVKPEKMVKLLEPYEWSDMEYYEVSKLVNSPRNDGPECISPLKDTLKPY